MTLTFDSLKPLTKFALISTDIDLPEGYDEAIKTNLAVNMAPALGREAPASVMVRAQNGLDFIRAQSNLHRKHTASIDPALRANRGRYNVVNDR